MALLPGSVYLHYKGGIYNIVSTIKLSDFEEEHVLYNSISYPKRSWLRPKSMFTGKVILDNVFSHDRFTEVKDIPQWVKERISLDIEEFNICQLEGSLYREFIRYRVALHNKSIFTAKGFATHTETENKYLIFDDIAISIGPK
jgi:hypothetical protein